MALVNHSKREINAKIVYFGPPFSGKATNLNYIFRKLKPEHRGKLKIMNILNDKMLFFDFMPISQVNVKGYNLHLHVFTLIGEATESSPWKMVLKGVDGVIFVADSDSARMAANQESLRQLRDHLAAHDRSLLDIPLVIQGNKRDLPSAVPLEEMSSSLQAGAAPLIPTIATRGEGVLDCLMSIMKSIQRNLREEGLELEKYAEETRAIPETTCDEPTSEVPVASESLMPDEEAPSESTINVLDYESPLHRKQFEPIVELAGDVECSEGRLRLPIIVRCGSIETRYAVTVALSKDAEH